MHQAYQIMLFLNVKMRLADDGVVPAGAVAWLGQARQLSSLAENARR